MNILGKKIIFSITVGLFIICQSLTVIAAEESITFKNEAINPGSFYYSIKRLWEKGKERLMFSYDSKKSFYESLLKTRLAELKYVVDHKFLSEVQTSSERFAYQAGILAEELIKQNKTKDKENLIKEFEQYAKFLDNLRDKYEANTSFWMLIQHDINTLKILSDQLK